jgi:hypothetical protein
LGEDNNNLPLIFVSVFIFGYDATLIDIKPFVTVLAENEIAGPPFIWDNVTVVEEVVVAAT